MSNKPFPVKMFHRVLKAGGKDVRVNALAAECFARCIEDIAYDIARDCYMAALHSGRKTIKKQDIQFALNHFQNEILKNRKCL